MADFLLSPPVAFVIYLVLVGVLSGLGKVMAGESAAPSAGKTSTYASGEAAPTSISAPGYRPFFVVALFFAILHLGVLTLGSSDFQPVSIAYLLGLMLALAALILG